MSESTTEYFNEEFNKRQSLKQGKNSSETETSTTEPTTPEPQNVVPQQDINPTTPLNNPEYSPTTTTENINSINPAISSGETVQQPAQPAEEKSTA